MARAGSQHLLPHLRAAKDLIDAGYAGPLDLDAMARRAGCSRYHFLRAFSAAYGTTPGRYLTARRIERARTLLTSANLTVTEVCLLVGFSSLGSFSAAFRSAVGMSPTAYRRAAAAAGGPPPVPGCFVLMWSHSPTPTSTPARPGRSSGSAIQEKRSARAGA